MRPDGLRSATVRALMSPAHADLLAGGESERPEDAASTTLQRCERGERHEKPAAAL